MMLYGLFCRAALVPDPVKTELLQRIWAFLNAAAI